MESESGSGTVHSRKKKRTFVLILAFVKPQNRSKWRQKANHGKISSPRQGFRVRKIRAPEKGRHSARQWAKRRRASLCDAASPCEASP